MIQVFTMNMVICWNENALKMTKGNNMKCQKDKQTNGVKYYDDMLKYFVEMLMIEVLMYFNALFQFVSKPQFT